MNQNRRWDFLCNLGVFEIKGKFALCPPWDDPKDYDRAWIASDVFTATHKRTSGILDNADYPYPEELFRSIQFTSEYKEWESLLPLIQGEDADE